MSAERFKEILLHQLNQSALADKDEFRTIVDAAFAHYANNTVSRITTGELALQLGIAGRVSVARQLLEGLGSQAKMDALKPGIPLSNTYWTVDSAALAALIADASRDAQ